MKNSILLRAIKLIPSGKRREALALLVLLTIGSILDVFSIAMFLPILVLIVDKGQAEHNTILLLITDTFNIKSHISLGVLLVILALVLIITKTFFNIWLSKRKALFSYTLAENLAIKSFSNFLYGSYRNFAELDYSAELNKVTNIPLIFANNILIPCATIFSEFIICFALFLFIAIYDPALFAFILILFIPTLVIYRFQKKNIKKSSDNIKVAYPHLLTAALTGIEAYVEIKSFGKEKYFTGNLKNAYKKMAQIFATDHSRTTSIGRLTEMLAGILVGVIILYILIFYQDKDDAFLLLSIYAGASIRVIPSVNRIFTSYVQIKTNEYCLDELSMINSFQIFENIDQKTLTFRNKIILDNISFTHPGSSTIIDQFNLEIGKGEKVMITGRSGKGKTTLLLLLMRFLKEQQGRIFVDDHILTSSDDESFRSLIGYVPQNPIILNTTISSNIAFGVPVESIDVDKVHRIIQSLGLNDWVSSLPDKIQTRIGEKGSKISGGQRQRIAIARALYHEKNILLLDEITNQLDVASEEEVLNVLDKLSKNGITIIFISHKISLQTFFDKAINMDALEKIVNGNS